MIMQDKGTEIWRRTVYGSNGTFEKQCDAGPGGSGGNVCDYRTAACIFGGAAGADGFIGCGGEYRDYCDLYCILLCRRIFDRQKEETEEVFVGAVCRRVLFCGAAAGEPGCEPGAGRTAGADADDGCAVHFVGNGRRDA